MLQKLLNVVVKDSDQIMGDIGVLEHGGVLQDYHPRPHKAEAKGHEVKTNLSENLTLKQEHVVNREKGCV